MFVIGYDRNLVQKSTCRTFLHVYQHKNEATRKKNRIEYFKLRLMRPYLVWIRQFHLRFIFNGFHLYSFYSIFQIQMISV